MDKIDFIITWVDGNDKKWQEERNKYKGYDKKQNSANRYRDMETLKYWFRSVEKYASWVNNIYFVTCGHLPDWLNTENEKLKIIRHEDYIDKKYLPTFNSNVIEMNFGNINGLSEYFVNFNDDMFITNYVKPDDFFKNGLPREYAILSPIIPSSSFEHTVLNNIILINENFNKSEVFRKYKNKFINVKYGKDLIRTILLKSWNKVCGFKESHLPHPLLKSTFLECYEKIPAVFDDLYTHRFRNEKDINQWLIEYWQFMSGKFEPISPSRGKRFSMSDINDEIVSAIKNKNYQMICINDGDMNYDFEKAKIEIISAFDEMFPEKSTFEK